MSTHGGQAIATYYGIETINMFVASELEPSVWWDSQVRSFSLFCPVLAWTGQGVQVRSSEVFTSDTRGDRSMDRSLSGLVWSGLVLSVWSAYLGTLGTCRKERSFSCEIRPSESTLVRPSGHPGPAVVTVVWLEATVRQLMPPCLSRSHDKLSKPRKRDSRSRSGKDDLLCFTLQIYNRSQDSEFE